MADYGNGDQDFSDDDLDELPAGALEELENNAIQLTQSANSPAQAPRHRPVSVSVPAPSSDYGDDFEDEDLDDAVVIDESRSTPAAITPVRSRHKASAPKEPFRPQQDGTNSYIQSQSRPEVPLFLPSRNTSAEPQPPRRSNSIPVRPASQQSIVVDDTADLTRELEELRRKNQTLEENLSAKTGEVAIVRSKQEKKARDHERELNAVRKSNEEKLAKQRKELDAARIAANSAATERDFFKQDLAESERVRRLNKGAEKRDLTSTPKKKNTLPHRDGFDDDEIELPSPSKLSPSKVRNRNTPSKPGKRKRNAVDSPVPALDVIQFEEPTEETVTSAPILDESILAGLKIEDDRFDFIGTMLDHRPKKDHLRTIEALAKYALPSTPNESLASVILGQIPALGLNKPTTQLPIEFCELLISIWRKCVEVADKTELYLEPLYLIVDMLTFSLELKTVSIAPHIVDTLVPLVWKTCDMVITPRFYKDPERFPMNGYDQYIDVTSCLALLHLTALGCMSEIANITRFWRMMHIGIVLGCLSERQLTPDFELMLKILSTSVLKETFGIISKNSEEQKLYTIYILDRIGYSLCAYKADEELPTDDVPVILRMRLAILPLLMSMTRSPVASMAMATHSTLIGRLVSVMSDELDMLYDWKAGHELSARILTLTTRLLYHLISKYDHLIIMQEKLTKIPGGSQKYLLALSRLNFSEDDLLLESGIGPDVPGLALEMLDMSCTPEEGDAIQEAFLAP